ncbi:MAG: ribonuclease HI [Clostridia bacterium]|nr:ribonuclease HI [Clostridia bacterium]
MIVQMFTDGACSGNPGPGGWCCILRWGEYEKMLSDGEAQTTNNRMELTAVVEGLRALNRPCEVRITTDSTYVADSVCKGWVYNWQKKDWLRQGKPVPNADLWQALLPLLEEHKVEFNWVRGHAGHPENERCDAEAVRQSRKY